MTRPTLKHHPSDSGVISGFNLKKIHYGMRYAEVRTYENPIYIPVPPEEKGERGNGSDKALAESRRRTIQAVTGIALSNDWDWFVTLTLDPEKVNRYYYPEVASKVSVWLRNARQRHARDLGYLLVPELHKDSAFHFHGLFKDCEGLDFRPSGKRDKAGREIYNVGLYGLGWTTATRVDDSVSAALYLTKYITKDLCAVTFNKKRYWASRNLARPQIQYDLLLDEERKTLEGILQDSCDIWCSSVLQTETYSNIIRYYKARLQ